jgi:transposase
MSPVLAGHHHDVFEAEKMVDKIFQDLQAAELSLDGLFLNADAGFDTKNLRNFCQAKGIIPNFDFNKRNKKHFDHQYIMDEELYKHRFVVERTNAWLDSFKALLVRFETRSSTWLALHYITFCFLLLYG